MINKATEKMTRKTDYPGKIKALLTATGMKQGDFAKALGVPQSLVSACQHGKKTPSRDLRVRLGNVAAEASRFDEAVWFWRDAGVRVESMVPATLELLKQTDAPITRDLMTSVPLNKSYMAAQGEEKGQRFLFPTGLLPDPTACSFVVITDDFLRPMFKPGDVLILDESESDIWRMAGSYVVAYRHASLAAKALEMHEKLTDAEYNTYASQRPGRLGLYAGWLNEIKRNDDVLLNVEFPTEMGSMSFDTLAIGLRPLPGGSVRRRIEIPEFSVLGRVVAWIDMRGMSPYLAALKSLPREAEQSQPQKPAANKSTKGKKKK